MLQVVNGADLGRYSFEMDQAFRLRHRVFVEEKGWTDLRQKNDLETDRFDDERAVHMLYVEAGRVIGYQRMLPTTRPHLLSDVMPELCEASDPSGRTSGNGRVTVWSLPTASAAGC